MKKTRFFYAPAIHRTWPKIFVLTEDGLLYCEYLEQNKVNKFNKRVSNIDFDEGEFKWGGYQSMHEIEKPEAISVKLTNQNNWVLSYLDNK